MKALPWVSHNLSVTYVGKDCLLMLFIPTVKSLAQFLGKGVCPAVAFIIPSDFDPRGILQ